jgi:uncharacterized protein YjbJ (UPF0337 family)
MKCAITGDKIEQTFLGKLLGTVVKDENGKKHYISSQAQMQYKNDKDQILAAIKKKH